MLAQARQTRLSAGGERAEGFRGVGCGSNVVAEFAEAFEDLLPRKPASPNTTDAQPRKT